MNMVLNYSQEAPAKAFAYNDMGMNKWHVTYDVVELPDEEKDATGYNHSYKVVALPTGIWSYDAIVDALVTAEYPSAKMQAVINNYLATPSDPDIKAEFDTMQLWRKEAKRIARESLAIIPDGN